MSYAPAFDESILEEPPGEPSLASARHARRCAAAIGPLRADGFPLAGPGLSCDPGTGGGQCLRLVVRARPAAPRVGAVWEGREAERAADAAWWEERGRILGGEPVPDLDLDAALPGRGAWET